MFSMYFKLGFEHISDFESYDHILFLLALTAVYMMRDWKKVAVLITAFTIGHSITLALATLKLIKVPTAAIEFLIPVTIFISAFADFFYKDTRSKEKMQIFRYLSALFFGLIHGMGFSNYLRAMLSGLDSILTPLFAFNLGVELGQITIVLIILSAIWLLVKKAHVPQRDLILILSGAAAGVAVILMIERFGAMIGA